MRRLVVFALGLLALFIGACTPGEDGYRNPFEPPTRTPTSVPTATTVPTATAVPAPTPAPTQPTSAPAATPIPAAPSPQPAVPTRGPSGTSVCDPLGVTSLGQRPPAVVNSTRVELEVRDINSCNHPLFYNETGVAKGQNYRLDLPQGWTAITASVTAEVQREGGQARQFLSCPIVVVAGPFQGGAGLYEGAIRVVPNEWVNDLLNKEVVPIQRAQCKQPNLQPTQFQG